MNIQRDRTLQEALTSLGVSDVITAAKRFFTRRNSIYSAFAEKEGPNYVSLRGQGGEEVIVAATPAEDGQGTRVTGSTYLFDQQLARFLDTLPPVGSEVAS
jgi:hypothetical protein